MLKLFIGSDHGGYEQKEIIKRHIEQKEGISLVDVGTYSADAVDYPDYANLVVKNILHNSTIQTKGILLCGSANGVAMVSNKYEGIRAAICWNETIAKLARQHNDANIICLPARFVSVDICIKMIDIFLITPFEGGRHSGRVAKIKALHLL